MAESWWENVPVISRADPNAKTEKGQYWWEQAPIIAKEEGATEGLPSDNVAPGSGSAQDYLKAAGTGYLKGAATLAGAPADIARLIESGARWGQRAVTGMSPEEQESYLRKNAIGYNLKDSLPAAPGKEEIIAGVERLAGRKLYEGQSEEAKRVGRVASFVPQAGAMGLGNVGRSLLFGAAIPAATSEATGEAAKYVYGPEHAETGRAVGAFAGMVPAMFATPQSAHQATSRALRHIDDPADVIRRAEQVMLASRQGATPVPVTWDEAINHVTDGAVRSLTDLRRVVEKSPRGQQILDPMMAQRPGQIRAAADDAIGAIAPHRMDPVRTGTAARRAAEREIADAQRVVNDVTRPDYAAAQRYGVGGPVNQALQGDELYARTLRQVRDNPELNRTIENLADDNVAVVDLVQRRMREIAENARMPGQAHTSNLAAANLEDARRAPIEAAERVTGGRYGDYARARATQQTMRQNLLEPLERGPLGSVSRTDDVLAQGNAILPRRPAPGSEAVVAETVGRLARQDPEAAANVIHSHLRAAFDDSTRLLTGGANPSGGAKYASVIAGNEQQFRNLEAGVRALPNGDQRWAGFNRFLDTMRVTGNRPQTGSMTAMNQAIQRDLEKGLSVADAGSALLSGGASVPQSMFRRFRDFQQSFNLGRNSEQVARLLVDPAAARVLERLATAPEHQWPILALRLTYMGRSAHAKTEPQKTE